jgi:cell wall-associated NlpC family hydrolase
MAVDDFLTKLQETYKNKQIVNPLTARNTPVAKRTDFAINPGEVKPAETKGFGEKVPNWLQGRTTTALDTYLSNKREKTGDLAQKYTDMAAGQVSVDEWGIPTDKLSNFSDFFNKNLTSIGNIGKSALATEEAKARWQTLQNQAELNAGYQVNWTPGASGDNPGAKAVAIAMQAQGTQYVWGGNSLTTGVDCSGLVQQVYKQLGINVPRTTYEQAKYGKVVSMGSLLPGDLIFYNTGSSDPNGIGQFSHVAIYIGNGQVIHAPGRGQSVKISSINSSGSPSRAVRPW